MDAGQFRAFHMLRRIVDEKGLVRVESRIVHNQIKSVTVRLALMDAVREVHFFKQLVEQIGTVLFPDHLAKGDLMQRVCIAQQEEPVLALQTFQ